MDLLPSSPTVPAGGSKHRRLGFYALPRTQQKHQVPNDENLQIESKLIQVIPYGERTKGKRSIWSETTIHRKSLTSDCSPSLGHLRISRLLGSESPVANPEVYQQGSAEDQALCGTAHSNKFCRCVSRPLNTATHTPPPPATVNTGFGSMYLASERVTFQALCTSSLQALCSSLPPQQIPATACH